MKKILFWLCLLCTIHLSAQDRILTLKQDTLKAKVSSIDKQKIVYYLDADKDKKLQELPVADLHKVIWRTGLEYIINQEFEDKQKKKSNTQTETKPISIAKPVEEKTQTTAKSVEGKSQIIEKEKEALITESLVDDAPKLRVRRWVLWRTYTSNGRRVGRNRMEEIMSRYDYETYQDFGKGNDKFKQGRKIFYLSKIPLFTLYIIPIYTPILPDLLLLGTMTMEVISIVKEIKGEKLMRHAVLAYEEKRLSNKLNPKFVKTKF